MTAVSRGIPDVANMLFAGRSQHADCFCIEVCAPANLVLIFLPMDPVPAKLVLTSIRLLQPDMMTHNVQGQFRCRFWNWKAAAAVCQEKGYSANELREAVKEATYSFQSRVAKSSGSEDVQRIFHAIIGNREVGPGFEVGFPNAAMLHI